MKAAILILAILAAPGEIGAFVTACTPDALRLCTAEQLATAAACGKSARCPPIHKCFAEHRREIGAACDALLKKRGH